TYTPTVTDPAIVAARTFVGHSLDAMRRAIVGSSPELLSWRPAGDDTNTIAVLAVHAVTSTRWWLSVAITGHAPERDRPSEFRTTVSSAEELLSIVDPLAAECRELLSSEDPLDLGASRTDPREVGTETTVAWALIHAIEHLQEHVAHTELTRQMWERKQGND
ncbi:MAG: DinB family protein, partial [Actinomycetota bacterium]